MSTSEGNLAPFFKTVLWLLSFLQIVAGGELNGESVPIESVILPIPQRELVCNGRHLHPTKKGCSEVDGQPDLLNCSRSGFSLTDGDVGQYWDLLTDPPAIDSYYIWKSDSPITMAIKYKTPYCISTIELTFHSYGIPGSCLRPHLPNITQVLTGGGLQSEEFTAVLQPPFTYHTSMNVTMATPICGGKIELVLTPLQSKEQVIMNEIRAFGGSKLFCQTVHM
jgi:hypothetical protein